MMIKRLSTIQCSRRHFLSTAIVGGAAVAGGTVGVGALGLAPCELPNDVIVEMAKRKHRLYHFLWHGVREKWAQLSRADRDTIKIIDQEWEPPHPAISRGGSRLKENGSGKDFLYMHHQMITYVNKMLVNAGSSCYQKVEGWANIPAPNDPDYPVPQAPDGMYCDGDATTVYKSDDYYYNQIRTWEQKFSDETSLRNMSLSKFGSDLEFTIHNALHSRWTAQPSTTDCRPRGPLDTMVNSYWDDSAYNKLDDQYSSHVNPVFWKLHGWIDDRVEDWKRANAARQIDWSDSWVGPMTMDVQAELLHDESDDDKLLKKFHQVFAIIVNAGYDGLVRPEVD